MPLQAAGPILVQNRRRGVDVPGDILAKWPLASPLPSRRQLRPFQKLRCAPVKLSLDESGAIVQTKVEEGVDERIQKAVEAALRNWRFTPARQGGKPVAAEITLSGLLSFSVAEK